jgi:hypothetical protein
MGVHKLQLNDFNTSEYELIAIHTTIESNKLAYLLNKNLDVKFEFFDAIYKSEKNVQGSFERYLFENKEQEISWNLVVNKSFLMEENVTNTFFDLVEKTMYLIPEYKNSDYILKIENENEFYDVDQIIKSINRMKFITTSYAIDMNKIKTKSNLIF